MTVVVWLGFSVDDGLGVRVCVCVCQEVETSVRAVSDAEAK